MVINIIGFICGFIGGVTDEFNCTSRQKIFWTILLPCMPLGCLCGIVIVKFFRWLAEEDKKDIVKDNKDDYYDYCLKCKYLKYLKNFDITNERTCATLDIVFNKGECPCNSKLFEKE